MAKIKLTRKSYKRNIIVFGLMIFMGIALVSTGFATWVLSQDTSVQDGGNVNVGVVSDNALKVTDLKYQFDILKVTEDEYTYETKTVDGNVKDALKNSGFSFCFEPKGGDRQGKVKWDKDSYNPNGEVNYELLKLVITGNISPVEYIDTITVKITIPEGLQNLVAKGYVVLPECAKIDEQGKALAVTVYEGGAIADGIHDFTINQLDKNSDKYGDFSLNVEFKWGEAFNATNPSLYFDSEDFSVPTDWKPEVVVDREYQYTKECLQDLRKEVHGCSYLTLDGVEYEAYTDGSNWYVLGEDGQYHNATVTGGALTNVGAVASYTPEQPTFNIEINITAK